MRIGNDTDGMYFFLLFLPIMLSIWLGEYLKRKITFHLVCDSNWSQHNSTLIGNVAETSSIIAGVITGFVLIRFI